MNERIKELALQAGLKSEIMVDESNLDVECFLTQYDANVPSIHYWEKFAELIVREMCQVINDDCELQMRQRIITNLGGLNQARELIKQHFGVEE